MTDFSLADSISTTVGKVATGAILPSALVASCLARIERANPRINAVVTLDADNALAQARRLDAGQFSAPVLPLLGVPVTIKDAFATAGLRTTSSFRPLADYVPTQDASIVARLKAAGAIVLGKTNLSE